MSHRSYVQIKFRVCINAVSAANFFGKRKYSINVGSILVREVGYRVDTRALAVSMFLVHCEADAIKCSALDLPLTYFLGTTEAISSRYHPLLQHSDFSICITQLICGDGSYGPACTIPWTILEEDTP